MKSFTTLVCPVTRKKSVIPLSSGSDGAPELESFEDDDSHPEGWGSLEARVAVSEVDEDEQEAYNAALTAQTTAISNLVDGAFSGPDAMANLSESTGREFTDEAEARAFVTDQIRGAVALEHPLPPKPEPTMQWRVQRWTVLSPEAFQAAMVKLGEAGFAVLA